MKKAVSEGKGSKKTFLKERERTPNSGDNRSDISFFVRKRVIKELPQTSAFGLLTFLPENPNDVGDKMKL